MVAEASEALSQFDAASALPPSSLIIASRDRPDLLMETVQSVLQGEEVPAELVIVDQSDVIHPQLPAFVSSRNCPIHYVWTDSRGLCRAMNEGIATAHHDLLVFTHDDVLVTPHWFGTLVRALLTAGSCAVVTGQVRPNDEVPGGFQSAIKVDPEPAVYQGRVGEDVLMPMNMAMRRSTVQQVGSFDVRFGPGTALPAAEDNDLGFRLLEMGYRIVYVPEALVFHRAWRTERDLLSLRWSYGTGQGAFYVKHLRTRDPYMLGRMWEDIWRHLRRVPFELVGHNRPAAEQDIVYVSGILYGAIRWQLTQRASRPFP
mgnify:CR=1 FL=1